MGRRTGRLARALLATLVVAGLAEVALRLARDPAQAYFIWPPYLVRLMEPSPDVFPGVSGPAFFRVNSRGLRADELLPGHAPVLLAVGGSTTECQVLDQDEAWPQLVQQALSVDGRQAWVGNAGRSGHTTREHVFQVPVLLDGFPRAEIVLVLAGANDLGLALNQGEAYDPHALEAPGIEARQIPRAFRHYPREFGGELPFAKRTELYAQLRTLKDFVVARLGLVGTASRGEAIARWRDNRAHASEWLAHLPDLGPAIAEYERHLTRIVTACQERGVTLVLMTQPSLWRADLDAATRGLLWWGGVGAYQAPGARVPYYTVEALADGCEQYNRALLRVAGATGAPVLDLAARIPRTTDLFFDDMHFTEAGARRVAQEVVAFLRRERLAGL